MRVSVSQGEKVVGSCEKKRWFTNHYDTYHQDIAKFESNGAVLEELIY